MSGLNENELLLKICNQLDAISKSVDDLNSRMNILEGKTDDIHKFTPFVGWLETVGHTVSKKWFWLRGVPDVPQLKDKKDDDDDNDFGEFTGVETVDRVEQDFGGSLRGESEQKNGDLCGDL